MTDAGQWGSTVNSVFDCHPDGQGLNPQGGNICEAVFGVPSLFVITRLVQT